MIERGTRLRRNHAAPDAPSAVLSYWYGLSGVLSKVLLELYLSPRGLTDYEIADLLDTRAQAGISRVYVSQLRTALRDTLDGANAIPCLGNPRRTGRELEIQPRRYRLTPAMREDVRETLEMALEQMQAVMPKQRRAA